MNVAMSNKIPRPFSISPDGDIYRKWFQFQEEFKAYLVLTELDGKSDDKVKAAELWNLIGTEGRLMTNLSLKHTSEYEDMITKLDNWAKSHRNVTKLRSQFFYRKQGENENFETFLNDVKTLIQLCNFGDLTEGLLRDKIISGISNPELKEFFDTAPNVPLMWAIQMCRMIDLSDDHLSTLLTLKRGGKITFEESANKNNVEASLVVDANGEKSDEVANNIDPKANLNVADSTPSETQKVESKGDSVTSREITRIIHNFRAKEACWGFKNFIEWDYLLNPDKGFIKDDSITLTVTISVAK